MGVPSVELGWRPVGLTVVLKQGINYTATISLTDADGVAVNWPVGTSARLVISKPESAFSDEWVPTVSTSFMTWDVDAADVLLVPVGSKAVLYLTYGIAAEEKWLSGGVVWA